MLGPEQMITKFKKGYEETRRIIIRTNNFLFIFYSWPLIYACSPMYNIYW